MGRHVVRLVPPAGWERLDHGRNQVFRRGEMEIVLADLGPATREGLERELRAAQRIAEEGRIEDAFERVRELQGPPFFLSSWQQRAEFWRPWHEVTIVGDRAGAAAIERAFDALLEGTAQLAPVTPEGMAAYALSRTMDTRRRQVAHETRRTLRDREWVEVETWDRVTHLERRRLACLDDGGYLLALGIERGPIEHTGPAFEALLGSLEVAPEAAPAVAQGTAPE